MRSETKSKLIAQLRNFALLATGERVDLWTTLADALEHEANCARSGDVATVGGKPTHRSKQTGESFAFLKEACIYRGDGESVQITHLYWIFVAEDGRAYLMTPEVCKRILEPIGDGDNAKDLF